MTLHKLLYDSKPKPDGTFIRIKKRNIGYRVVVVDEVSMAPKEIMDLLFSHRAYIICLGDPLLDHPHIFLDEIMRQEMDSEIIRLTLDIRAGKRLELFNGHDVKVYDKTKLSTGMMLWADQIISGTNKTRTEMNNTMRALLQRSDNPEDGDKVICLRNYWDNIADTGDYLVNGTIGFINNSYPTFHKLPYFFGGKIVPVLCANFISDTDADYGVLRMDKTEILTGERFLDNKTIYNLRKGDRFSHLVPYEFTYGYAITCHKAQGSEWNKVLVIEERFPFDKEEHTRWLYTAATRAIDKLVIVR